MTVSPLALGLITGAAQIDDPGVDRALDSMLSNADRDELIQALMDMTGLLVALSDHADVTMDQILLVVAT